MLNRSVTISILVLVNVALDSYVLFAQNHGLLNNSLMIASLGLLSVAIYRVLGMVEGYK